MANNVAEVRADTIKVGDLLDAELGWRKVKKIKRDKRRRHPDRDPVDVLVFTCAGDKTVGKTWEAVHEPDALVRTIYEHVEVEPDERGYLERLELVHQHEDLSLTEEEHKHLRSLRKRYGKGK